MSLIKMIVIYIGWGIIGRDLIRPRQSNLDYNIGLKIKVSDYGCMDHPKY